MHHNIESTFIARQHASATRVKY